MLRHLEGYVSISLSSGFSFQGRGRRYIRRLGSCFNLVIERLLISGEFDCTISSETYDVSISLSSGFSFQDISGESRCTVA